MKPISVKTKIYCGFAVMFLVIALNTWFASRGVRRLNGQVARAQQAGDTKANIIRFDRDIQELQGLVDRYIESGDPVFQIDISELHGSLVNQLSLATESQGAELADAFAQIEKSLRTHEAQFAKVVNERRIRQTLLEDKLPFHASEVDNAIQQLLQQIESQPEPAQPRLIVTQSLSLFWQAEKCFLRYFDAPNSRAVSEGLQSLASSKSSLQQSVSAEDAKTALQALERYEQSALRAVQATRSYLHLRGVVMAGEASEIAYYSDRIRKLAEQESQKIAAGIRVKSNEVYWGSVVVLIGAAAVAALVAFGLVWTIVPALTSLTNAFSRLAEGAVIDHVSESSRPDEIGEMARAAEVFSRQNHETRRLLQAAEKLTNELQLQKQELEITNQELDSFAYVASHDLKSPLRGIRQLAEWINEDLGDQVQGQTADYLTHLTSRVSKMEKLLADLLDYSRVGRMNPESEAVDLNDVVDWIVELVDNPNQVDIRVNEPLPTLTTVRPPIEQVFLNLVGNAVKHHDKGGQGFIEIRHQERAGMHEFQVADNGPGVDPTNHERMFQMYQRVGSIHVDGTGMGLAIVKKQIEYYGGSIGVQSCLGEGAVFTFTWPKLTA